MVDLSRNSDAPVRREAPAVHLLVIDPSPAGQALAAALDEHAGWIVHTAGDRESALDYMGRRDLSLVVMDVSDRLPERGALYYDFIQTPANQLTRFLLLATDATLNSARKMVYRPLDEIALKPIATRELVRRIHGMLAAHERTDIQARVRLYHTEGDDPFPLPVQLHNISGGGMFVQTQRVLTVGSVYRIVINVPEHQGDLVLTGKVRRKEQMGGDTGYGVQFLSLETDPGEFFKVVGVPIATGVGGPVGQQRT